MKQIMIAALIATLGAVPAMAACPPAVAGDEAEAAEANRQRLACLQQEMASDAETQRMKLDLQMLEMKQDQLELQRRLDAIPKPPPPVMPQF